MELKKHITDEKTGISYTLCGDYYLPDLALPEEKYYELGRFGRAKFRHLQKCHKVLLTSLRTNGTLIEYLHSVDENCEEMFSRLVKQYTEREGVTEQMKADEMMKWVGLMNNIRSRAEEVVMREYIYEED
ncbi:MAG: TnpV protein [Clostridia bacterium]|nr:TnpV protein [Clostridia bacterium]